jgi:hypothetical protein
MHFLRPPAGAQMMRGVALLPEEVGGHIGITIGIKPLAELQWRWRRPTDNRWRLSSTEVKPSPNLQDCLGTSESLVLKVKKVAERYKRLEIVWSRGPKLKKQTVTDEKHFATDSTVHRFANIRYPGSLFKGTVA